MLIHTPSILIDKSYTKSIFLAGPSLRNINGYTPWRIEALDILKRLEFDGVVLVPEPFHENYNHQVAWETDALKSATQILFWIPRDLTDLPGFTTNFELGEHLNSGKITIGFPEDAPKTRYIKKRAEMAHLPIQHDLTTCIQAALTCIDQ